MKLKEENELMEELGITNEPPVDEVTEQEDIENEESQDNDETE